MSRPVATRSRSGLLRCLGCAGTGRHRCMRTLATLERSAEVRTVPCECECGDARVSGSR